MVLISIYESTPIMVYFLVLAGVLGAVMGSFLNCTAYRISRRQSFTKGRSRCPSCGHELGALDLIPILSWLFLRGKCRYCKEKVSPRYFITECLMAAVSIVCMLQDDVSVMYVRDMVFICCLFCLSLVDLEIFEIPDGTLIISAAVWFAALPFVYSDDIVGALWKHVLAGVILGGGVLVISLILDSIMKKDTMGGGDIKLLAVCGLYLGFVRSIFMIILACFVGIIGARILRGRRDNISLSEDEIKDDAAEVLSEDEMKNEAAEILSEDETKIGAAEILSEDETSNDVTKILPEDETSGVSANVLPEALQDEVQEDIRQGHVPFGPAISIAAFAMLLFGEALERWYMGLF